MKHSSTNETAALEDYFGAKRRLLNLDGRPIVKRIMEVEFDNGAPLYRTFLVKETNPDRVVNSSTWPLKAFDEYGSCYITFLNSAKDLYSVTFEDARVYHCYRQGTDTNNWFDDAKQSEDADANDMRFNFDIRQVEL